jgi:hypothetical protein
LDVGAAFSERGAVGHVLRDDRSPLIGG